MIVPVRKWPSCPITDTMMAFILNRTRTRMPFILLILLLTHSGCSRPDYRSHPELTDPTETTWQQLSPLDKTLVGDTSQREHLPIPGSEKGNLDLSLEQAVFYTLQRNRELQVQRLAPILSGTFTAIERGVYDPEMFAELLYAKEIASETSRSTGERFSVKGEDIDGVAGLRQRLPSGTELEASLAHGRSTSDRTPKQQEARIGLTVTQSLLKGLGPSVNLVDIRQAHLESRASLHELRGFVEALVAEVEIAYWQFVLATEGITIFQRSLAIARQQLHEVENRIEVGVLPRNAAAAARTEVARRQQALIDARSRRHEHRLRLLRLLYAADNDQFDLTITPASPAPTASPPLTDLKERLHLAERRRPDLGEARLRQRQHRLELVRTKNGLLPKLDLFMEIGKTGYAESFSGAWQDLDEDNYEVAAGLRFSTFIGNRQAEARNLAARASLVQAATALENMRTLVHLDVRLAFNETERSRQQIEASRVTRTLQEQTVQAEQDRFATGDSTSLLVAQAQRDLLMSQLDEIESIVHYRIALVNLYLAEGTLLERRGMTALPVDHPLGSGSERHGQRPDIAKQGNSKE